MSDSLKFGPEWLRNMSNDTGNISSTSVTTAATSTGGTGATYFAAYSNSNPRYPLAEFRYGREEMLSLYDKNFKLPELLPKFNKLFIEKMHCPLALLPPTADEEVTRGLTPIGSLTNERTATSTSGTALGGISSGLSGISSRGTRGSSIDRGRGRARGGLYHSSLGSYQRSAFLYDEESRARGERSWVERNGSTAAETDWNSAASTTSPSPRKDFTSLRSGGAGAGAGAGAGESWRRSRVEEESGVANVNGTATDGWRTSANNSMYKWPVRSTSWRGGENEPGPGGSFNSDVTSPTPRLERSKSTHSGMGLSNRDIAETSNQPGGGGINRRYAGLSANTSWDEDNLPEWAMDEPIEGGGSFDASGAFLGCEDRHMNEKSRDLYHLRSNIEIPLDEDDDDKVNTQSHFNNANEKESPSNDAADTIGTSENEDENRANFIDDRLPPEKTDKDVHHDTKQHDYQEFSGPEITEPKISPTQMTDAHVANAKVDKPLIPTHEIANTVSSNNDRMQEVAEDIEKLIMDDDPSCNENNSLLSSRLHLDSHKHSSAEDALIGDKINDQSADLSDWYYRDPQGKVQGPFTATEMLEWYRAGYFDENLYVKRVCDPQFLALGELLKLCSGSIPFVSLPIIPQLLQTSSSDINLGHAPTVPPSTPTKPLTNHLVRNAKLSSQPASNNPNSNASVNPLLDEPVVQHMHSAQKFFLNPQALAIKQLETEPWNILSPEQQATLIAQRLAQNQSPNDILPPQGLVASANQMNQQQSLLNHLMGSASPKNLSKHPNQHIANLSNPLNKQAHLKNQQQSQSLQHMLNQHKKDFSATDSVNGNNVPVNMLHADQVQHMFHSIGLNHPQLSPTVNVLPVPSMPQQPPSQQSIVENNPLKSLLLQLGGPSNVLQKHNHQHHPPPTAHLHTQPAENRLSMPNAHVHGLWDIQLAPSLPVNPTTNMPNLHNNLVPSSSMKTEMHILEQHMHAKAKKPGLRFQFKTAPVDDFVAAHNHEIQKSLFKQQDVHFLQHQQQQHQHHQQQQQLQQQHQQEVQSLQNELLQQTDIFKAKIENFKDDQLSGGNVESKTAKPKIDALDASKSMIDAKIVHNFSSNSIVADTIDVKNNNNNGNSKMSGKIDNMGDVPNDDSHVEKVETKPNKLKTSAGNVLKQSNESKINQKLIANNGSNNNSSDLNFMSNVNNTANNNKAVNSIIVSNNNTVAAPKNAGKESTKKKGKDKDHKTLQQAEERKRQLEEEERQMLEEKKRLEIIAAQRKAKLVDQNSMRNEQGAKRNNLAASVAPWSNLTDVAAVNVVNTPLNFAEIQKAERERRSEHYRLEQAQQQTQAMLEQQQQKDAVLKWKLKPQNQTKSLAEIQAEESKARQTIQQISLVNAQQKQQNTKKDDKWVVSQWSMIWGEQTSGSGNMVTGATSSNGNTNCFWDDSSKPSTTLKVSAQQNGTGKALTKSQTVSNMQSTTAVNAKSAQSNNNKVALSKTSSSGNVVAANTNATVNSATNNKKLKGTASTSSKKGGAFADESNNDEFNAWCSKALSAHVDVIDVPTFVSFLRDIESPFEVKDYIRMYLGETKECGEFAKHFLERRSKYKNQQRAANAHIDDMCSPAPALTPVSDCQEAKGKGKKEKKKNKMMKLDSRILGFSVTSAEDRLNVGARDYARDGP